MIRLFIVTLVIAIGTQVTSGHQDTPPCSCNRTPPSFYNFVPSSYLPKYGSQQFIARTSDTIASQDAASQRCECTSYPTRYPQPTTVVQTSQGTPGVPTSPSPTTTSSVIQQASVPKYVSSSSPTLASSTFSSDYKPTSHIMTIPKKYSPGFSPFLTTSSNNEGIPSANSIYSASHPIVKYSNIPSTLSVLPSTSSYTFTSGPVDNPASPGGDFSASPNTLTTPAVKYVDVPSPPPNLPPSSSDSFTSQSVSDSAFYAASPTPTSVINSTVKYCPNIPSPYTVLRSAPYTFTSGNNANPTSLPTANAIYNSASTTATNPTFKYQTVPSPSTILPSASLSPTGPPLYYTQQASLIASCPATIFFPFISPNTKTFKYSVFPTAPPVPAQPPATPCAVEPGSCCVSPPNPVALSTNPVSAPYTQPPYVKYPEVAESPTPVSLSPPSYTFTSGPIDNPSTKTLQTNSDSLTRAFVPLPGTTVQISDVPLSSQVQSLPPSQSITYGAINDLTSLPTTISAGNPTVKNSISSPSLPVLPPTSSYAFSSGPFDNPKLPSTTSATTSSAALSSITNPTNFSNLLFPGISSGASGTNPVISLSSKASPIVPPYTFTSGPVDSPTSLSSTSSVSKPTTSIHVQNPSSKYSIISPSSLTTGDELLSSSLDSTVATSASSTTTVTSTASAAASSSAGITLPTSSTFGSSEIKEVSPTSSLEAENKDCSVPIPPDLV